MTTLRTILKRSMICCLPWRIWKGEIDYLPISSKTLFSKTGIPIDILEQDLKSIGYLYKNEDLLEVLKDSENLKRTGIESDGNFDDINFGLIPEDFEEEDFENLDEKLPF